MAGLVLFFDYCCLQGFQYFSKMLGNKASEQLYLKALIVEDDPILQIVHQKILRSLYIDSIVAGTGSEAIQALENIQFDFVLMDINMPEQDGLDASRWIRDEKEKTFK